MKHARWVALVATIASSWPGPTASRLRRGDQAGCHRGGGHTHDDPHRGGRGRRQLARARAVRGLGRRRKGWAKYINANGGVAGRKVVVDFIDSKLSGDEARNAVIKACAEDFALVGTSAVFLNNVDDIEGCVDKAGAATASPTWRSSPPRSPSSARRRRTRSTRRRSICAPRISTRRPTRPTSGGRTSTRRSSARTSTAAYITRVT